MTKSDLDRDPILRLEGLGKKFCGLIALDDVDMSLWEGEVHALLGENGAGKSTLIKILTGVHRPDTGRILLEGKPCTIGSPREARAHGISLVPQDTLAVPELSIGRNILLGIEEGRTSRARLSAQERDRVVAALAKTGASFDPETLAGALGVPQIRLAQIARALLQPGKIMVLDEPTAVLSEPDADHLLERLDVLRKEGHAILYVTHRLSEVMRLADRSTILRDGALVGSYDKGEINREETVRLIARDVAEKPRPADLAPDYVHDLSKDDAPVLEVSGLTMLGQFQDISFTAPAGSVVGIAGVQGSGHGELLRAVGGAANSDSGEVRVDGRSVPRNDPIAAVNAGILTIPADRRGAAIVPELSMRANVAMSGRVRQAVRKWGFRSHRAERKMMAEYIKRLSVRPALPDMPIGNLSGGNQQKVALARILEGAPKVLAIEEPTQGIDVSAKAEIHELLHRVARDTGAVVLIASSEFEELVGLADDVFVMRSGEIAQHIAGSTATYHKILENALP
jgi:ABC-type sugar transport system ATPase subunit